MAQIFFDNGHAGSQIEIDFLSRRIPVEIIKRFGVFPVTDGIDNIQLPPYLLNQLRPGI